MNNPVSASELSKETILFKDICVSLRQIIEGSYQNNYAIAAWKNAGDNEINVVIDTSDFYKNPLYPELESIESGFLVSPFLNDSNHLNYLIKADFHFKGKDSSRLYFQHQDTSGMGTDLGQFINSLPDIFKSKSPRYYINGGTCEPNSTKNDFLEMVHLAIEQIKAQNFLKVVPSRRETINLSESFNIVKAFVTLTNKYPHAFVSFFSIPEKGTWMGASPEILIEIDRHEKFRTSAVAATQYGNENIDLSSVAWTQKEIEEQAIVSRYIINCFKKIRLREFDEYGPKTIKAGNLVHLRTDFTVNIHDVNFPQLGSVMLKLLHPTSAVCGMPKESSLEFLLSNEKYDREFYSGYIGPVNMEDHTSLYVNLRCAKLLDGKAYIYAGAGITIDSNPEKEWQETLIKNQTIQEVLTK